MKMIGLHLVLFSLLLALNSIHPAFGQNAPITASSLEGIWYSRWGPIVIHAKDTQPITFSGYLNTPAEGHQTITGGVFRPYGLRAIPGHSIYFTCHFIKLQRSSASALKKIPTGYSWFNLYPKIVDQTVGFEYQYDEHGHMFLVNSDYWGVWSRVPDGYGQLDENCKFSVTKAYITEKKFINIELSYKVPWYDFHVAVYQSSNKSANETQPIENSKNNKMICWARAAANSPYFGRVSKSGDHYTITLRLPLDASLESEKTMPYMRVILTPCGPTQSIRCFSILPASKGVPLTPDVQTPSSVPPKLSIDFSFISDLEGGQVLVGYVPDPEHSHSGVTVATGVDLGQLSKDQIDRLNIPDDLKAILDPYAVLKSQSAVDYLQDHPLSLKESQANALDAAIKQSSVDKLLAQYDASTAGTQFSQLPPEAQTVIASVAFQYGDLSIAAPKFWADVTQQNWSAAITELQNFQDDYPTRRSKEATLLGHDVTPRR